MLSSPASPARRGLSVILPGILTALLVAGCGGGEKLVPVEGTVTVGAEPLKTGSIAFHPDPDKGSGPLNGTIENGKYKIYRQGNPGAPVGSYKVTVHASVPSNPKDEYSLPKSLISESFGTPKSTTLTAQVKDGGGPYDFKVTK